VLQVATICNFSKVILGTSLEFKFLSTNTNKKELNHMSKSKFDQKEIMEQFVEYHNSPLQGIQPHE